MNEANKASNRIALVAMLLGISGMMLSCLVVGGVISIAGLIIGIVSLRDADCTKKGFSVTGIITSAVGIIVAIVALFALIGVLNYENLTDVNQSTQSIYQNVTELP